MISFLDSIWNLIFAFLQLVFDFDHFIGWYIGLTVVFISTVFTLAFIIISVSDSFSWR